MKRHVGRKTVSKTRPMVVAMAFHAPYLAVLLITIFAFLVLCMMKPAHAADDAFMRDFRTTASESHSFSLGRTASFYKNTDDVGYGTHLSGTVTSNNNSTSLAGGLASAASGDGAMDLEHRAHLTTLLVNGSYDLQSGFLGNLPWRPYVMGGMGIALYDTSAAAALGDQGGTDVVPMVHVGGGLAYRMGEAWDMALSYKAGFAGGNSVGLTSNHSQQNVDLQMVDVGFRFRF